MRILFALPSLQIGGDTRKCCELDRAARPLAGTCLRVLTVDSESSSAVIKEIE